MFRSLRNRLIFSHILPALLIIPLMGAAMVYVHIRWLREKLETDPGRPKRILTVRGVGYKLVPQ